MELQSYSSESDSCFVIDPNHHLRHASNTVTKGIGLDKVQHTKNI